INHTNEPEPPMLKPFLSPILFDDGQYPTMPASLEQREKSGNRSTSGNSPRRLMQNSKPAGSVFCQNSLWSYQQRRSGCCSTYMGNLV
ncbi:hypothetical protein, partial [Yoonia sp.]|uniref:hypothetical protein n=1 Tax=Yoonia sp. TaxID=2212373 RepID=UPI004047A2CA